MMKNTLKYLAALGLAVGLTQSALAWPDAAWTGLANDGLWTSPGNWSAGVVPGVVSGGDSTNVSITLDAANGWSTVTIPATTNITLTAQYATIYGPEWGVTFNIRGTVYNSWYLAPVGPTSIINMYTNSGYYGEGIGLGNNWWYWGGAGVTLNLNANAQVGINTLYWGGHVNLKDQSVMSITNGVDERTQDTVSDATRSINLAGGTLVLPTGFTATVNDWITRGILLVYGVPNDAAQIVIDEANTNWPGRTVVYTTATAPNPILDITIELPRTSLLVGGVEQVQVFADYAFTAHVNVTTLLTNLIYQSSAPGMATISTNGFVRATGVGTATLKAISGALSNSITVNVLAYTHTTSLIHRYSFNDTAGSATAADSVPGNSPAWDATLNGAGASLTGSQLVLDGIDGFAQMPAAILSGLDAVTFETWATFGTIGTWANLFAFGDSDGTSGHNYITCQPHTGPLTAQTGIKNGAYEQNPWFTPVLDNFTNVHIVAVFHPSAGYCSIYTNGVLAAINSSITITLADALSTGDPVNYIGHSLYSADPLMAVTMNEFRIYDGPLSAAQIAADHALGPNQLIGTSTSVTLSASLSGGSLVIKWPTTSALVNLMSTPALGSGAVWTQVNGTLATDGSGKYQMTIPITGSAQFFRLQQ
jgi:hypothetical protein